MPIRFVPVIVDYMIQLYDIYIDGVWFGSKRTKKQCEERVRWLTQSG